jgi:hypothetical protein
MFIFCLVLQRSQHNIRVQPRQKRKEIEYYPLYLLSIHNVLNKQNTNHIHVIRDLTLLCDRVSGPMKLANARRGSYFLVGVDILG